MFLANIIFLILPVLLAIAFLTLVERKILIYMQLHKGSNSIGPYGLLPLGFTDQCDHFKFI